MTDPRQCEMYIDGRFGNGGETEWLDVMNPGTEQIIARAPDARAPVVDAAVAAAKEAWQTWRWTNPFERSQLLHAIGDKVTLAERLIATAITEEMGKPLGEARGEAKKLAKAFHYYAEEAVRVFGSTIPNEDDGFISIVEKEPVGVVGAIAPWNYPVELIGWKLAAALAAGCTIVVKPSIASSAQELFRCLDEAGLPPGVANLVMGARETGRLLVGHPDIDKVAFTGSQAAGEDIYRTVRGITPLSLELGGSCPLIVTGNADIERAVAGTLRRAFRNAGQICISINRAYVHESVYGRFVDQLASGRAGLVVADGLLRENADVGPMTCQCESALERRHLGRRPHGPERQRHVGRARDVANETHSLRVYAGERVEGRARERDRHHDGERDELRDPRLLVRPREASPEDLVGELRVPQTVRQLRDHGRREARGEEQGQLQGGRYAERAARSPHDRRAEHATHATHDRSSSPAHSGTSRTGSRPSV